MTNEKLGVLMVDVPEPQLNRYVFILDVKIGGKIVYTINESDFWEDLIDDSYHCTKEEAKKYPQFRWVALEDLK